MIPGFDYSYIFMPSRKNMGSYSLNIAKDYYSIDKSALTTDVDFSVYAESISKLCNASALEKTYHIRHGDDRVLSSILKNQQP